jgi:hypothetical protein
MNGTDKLQAALDALVAALQDVEDQLRPVEREAALLRQKRDDLAEAVSRLRRIVGEGADVPAGFLRPKTTDGIVQILEDKGGFGTLEEIRQEFRNRGWLEGFGNPDAAVYAATKRLADAGRIERMGEGRYRLVSKPKEDA